MLELLFALLMQFITLQNGIDNAATNDKGASSKNTTITTNKAPTSGTTPTSIGSGGWDDKN